MKTFLKFLAVLFLLGVIAVVAVGFYLGPITKKAVNTVGPKVTGTHVELDDAKINLLGGSGSFAGLFVGNPEGWTGDKAMYLVAIRASIQPRSLLSDHIVVNEVFIDGPEFVYERRLIGGSNIDALLKQIETNTGGPRSASDPAPADPDAKAAKFAVKSFVVQNARVSLIAGGQTIALTLPTLTLTDIGVAEGGITADQVATVVLRQLLAQMVVAAADTLKTVGAAALEGGGEGAKAAGQGILDRLRGK